jgi:hypothetical protein
MNTFQKDLAFTFIKAAILTIIVVGAIASISSCERVADRNIHYSNTWRATALKTGRPLTVKNLDSLCVSSGDTVTVFLGGYGDKQYYYISNTPDIACDTMTMEMLIDGKDTLYEPFEAWNVRLERRIAK